jgi:hypothetical protein
MFTRSALGAAGTDIHHVFNQQIVEADRFSKDFLFRFPTSRNAKPG